SSRACCPRWSRAASTWPRGSSTCDPGRRPSMPSKTTYSHEDIVRAVLDALAAVAPPDAPRALTARLLGDHAIIDSVGFVTLLVEAEQNLSGAVDLAALYLAHAETAREGDEGHPFATAGSLVEHIE